MKAVVKGVEAYLARGENLHYDIIYLVKDGDDGKLACELIVSRYRPEDESSQFTTCTQVAPFYMMFIKRQCKGLL